MSSTTRRRLALTLLIGAIAWIPGCVEEDSAAVLVPRAQFDLDCPRHFLRWVSIDEKTWGVTGCGRRATYIEVCQNHTLLECRWVMNSATNLVAK